MLKGLGKFLKIEESQLQSFFVNRDIKDLLEHPQTLTNNLEILSRINNLKELLNLYDRLSFYKEYEFKNYKDIAKFVQTEYINKTSQEIAAVFLLDKDNKLLGKEFFSLGTINMAIFAPRDIMKLVFKYEADKVVLSHNHPSGSVEPSKEDIASSQRIEKILNEYEVEYLDNIIVGEKDTFSFKENNLLFDKEFNKKDITKIENLHIDIHNKDVDRYFYLLNKFTKLSKLEIKEIKEKNISIKDFSINYEKYISNQNVVEKFDKIIKLKNQYDSLTNKYQEKMKSPLDVENFIKNKYYLNSKSLNDKNIILYLNTKNVILHHEIVPGLENQKEEVNYVYKNAIINDANSVIKISISNETHLDNNIDSYKNFKNDMMLRGLNSLDNIVFKNNKFYSLKEIENQDINNFHIRENETSINMEKEVSKLSLKDIENSIKCNSQKQNLYPKQTKRNISLER